MIPLYALQAAGGKIYSLDDPAVVKDGAALDGTGGTLPAPFLISTPLGLQFDLGYNKLRRFSQRLAHAGIATLTVTGIADGRESATPIVRSVGLSDAGIVEVPLNDAASDFQLKLALSAYDGEVGLGNSVVYVVERRRFR